MRSAGRLDHDQDYTVSWEAAVAAGVKTLGGWMEIWP